MKNKKLIILFIILIVVFSVVILLFTYKRNFKEPKIISELAYDVNKQNGYTVWIKENNEYVPYLVLTNNYNNNTLLLRKYLLDEPLIYNDYYSYYKNTYIDKYLNEEFISILSDNIKNKIIDTNIIITSEPSIGICGQDTEKINRRIFLLSYKELCFEPSTLATVEGNCIKYFNDDVQRKIAYNGNNASAWWTRTTYNIYDNAAFGIGPEGTVGGGGVYEQNGVRPAFTVPNNLKILKTNDNKYIFEIE